MKPVLLVVEDDDAWWYTLGRLFGQRAELIFAASVAEADRIFTERGGDLAGIVVDGCLNHEDRFDTGQLVRYFRKRFAGPIVAASSVYNRELMEAGCTHQAETKDAAAQIALENASQR
ncbi:MAG: hypothetical protein HY340_02040 [Candidatus Kerfeldbacteria bacterium]|nr:hypothetical protein [Candidatus Kerfeldbacteria bacterium]